jgi:hypothetical protein
VTTAWSRGFAAHAVALTVSRQVENVTTRVAAAVGVHLVLHHTAIPDTPLMPWSSEIPVLVVQQGLGGLALRVWLVESIGV